MFKPKKIMSLFLSAVMTLSSFSAVQLSAAAEENDGNAVSSDQTEYSVKGNNAFGDILAGDIQEKFDVNGEHLEYCITNLEYDSKMEHASISYSAKKDCIIFLGFYTDDGNSLITSTTQEVPASESGTADLYAVEKLPEFYLIKAFIVGLDNRPLSTPFAYNRCTKEMHDILNTSASDLEKQGHDVVKLENDDNNNFFVPTDDAITIESTETQNIYKGQDADGNYIFENPDEELFKKIKKGSVIFARETDDVLLFKVADKSTSDGNILLTADSDAELNDVCSFIKIDTSQTKKAESEYSSEKATEEVVVEKVKTQEVSEFLANPYSYCMPAARKLLEVDFADNYSDTYIFTLGLFKSKSNSQIVKCYTERAVDKHPKIW